MKAYKYILRLKLLKAVLSSLKVLSAQIDYALISIPDCFEKIGHASDNQGVKKFYNYMAEELNKVNAVSFGVTWKYGVDNYLSDGILTDSECQVLNTIGDMPLYLNKDIQINVIESVSNQLQMIITSIEKECQIKCRIYKITGIAVGMMFVLLLL